jgi:hypothetical protein
LNKNIVAIYIKDNFGEKSPKIRQLNEIPRINDAIFKYTDYLPKSASITERCYNIVNGLDERAVCACGKVLKFKSYKEGYGKKCSKTCKG